MSIDPKLERLQSLIEQKHSQLQRIRSRNIPGKSGNPRFAEAARRVSQNLRQKGIKRSDLSATNRFHNQSFQVNRSNGEASRVERGQIVEKSEFAANRSSRPLGAFTAPSDSALKQVRSGEEHLGLNIDLYA